MPTVAHIGQLIWLKVAFYIFKVKRFIGMMQ